MHSKIAFILFGIFCCWNIVRSCPQQPQPQLQHQQFNEHKVCSDNEGSVVGSADYLVKSLLNRIEEAKCSLTASNQWPQDYADKILNNDHQNFDYIVIGAGTAGSVVASRLSEQNGVTVLVLEAGDDPPLESEIFNLSSELHETSYSWTDFSVNNPNCCQAMVGSGCYWPRGKMIGGTGAINDNVFLGGLKSDYDEWQQMGCKGWSWEDIRPYYQYAMNGTTATATGQPRGSLVLNYFQRTEGYQNLLNLISNATMELQSYHPSTFHRLKTGKLYDGKQLGTIAAGIRMSTGKTYLAKVAAKNKNLQVVKRAVVTRILFNSNYRAVGVEFQLRNRTLHQIYARREIVLSAGAFGSPKILMLSGIGHYEYLLSLNIKPLINLPVGDNLQDHGMMSLILKFTRNPPEIYNFTSVESTFDYFLHRKGPLASGATLIDFINTQNREYSGDYNSQNDMMLIYTMSETNENFNVFEFLRFKKEYVQAFWEQTKHQVVLEVHGLVFKPKSRGFVRLNSQNPYDNLYIYNNYGWDEDDRKSILGYVRYIQNLTNTCAFRHYGLELVHIPISECDKLLYDSDEYWLCYMKYFYVSAWHAAGTCRMGSRRNPKSVVDDRLRVLGVNGLRVIDASIMPNITSGNTNIPTVIIAEKGADMIKMDARRNYFQY